MTLVLRNGPSEFVDLERQDLLLRQVELELQRLDSATREVRLAGVLDIVAMLRRTL